MSETKRANFSTTLKPNPKAKARREQIRFFDSADWAMNEGIKEMTDDTSKSKSFPQTPYEGSPPKIEVASMLAFSSSIEHTIYAD